MKNPLHSILKSLLIVSLFAGAASLRAQGTAFTYQGLLDISNSPATGSYDLEFQLYNAATTNGTAVDLPVAITNVAVSNGLFTVSLSFSNINFIGTNYWVEISATTNGGTNYSPLNPLIPITPAPYAISAGTASNLLGALPLAQLPAVVVTNNATNVTLGGTFSGNGAGLTGVSVADVTGDYTNNFTNAVNITNSGNVFAGNGAGLTSLNAAQLTGSWTNASVAGISNSGSYIQTNTATGAFAIISTNAHLHLTDEWGTSYNTYTNGTLTIVMTNGNTLNWSNGSLTLISNTSYLSYSNGNLAVSGSFAGNGSNLTGVTAAAFGGALSNASLTGAFTNAVTISNAGNVFVGSGAGLSNLAYWSLTGNAGTTPGMDFIGTTDTNTLEFHVNGRRALILDGSFDPDQPNVIGGDYRNTIANGVYGSVISGGHENLITTNANSSEHSTISGGNFNLISNNNNVTISGGDHNSVQNESIRATIGGGYENNLNDAPYGFIGGGQFNSLSNVNYATISGGFSNSIAVDDDGSFIGGGVSNYIGRDSDSAAVVGGYYNSIDQNSYAAVIGGGSQNSIASASWAAIPGGWSNSATGQYSLAAGQQAQALNQGAFVWADSQAAPFASTANDQFIVRAQGGVGINTNNPGGAALNVNGAVVAASFSGDGGGLTNLLLTNPAPSLPASFGAMTTNVYYTNTWNRPAYVSVVLTGPAFVSDLFYLFSTNTFSFPPVQVEGDISFTVRDFMLPPNWWFSVTNNDSEASTILTNYVILQ